jgi:hypothetical protein
LTHEQLCDHGLYEARRLLCRCLCDSQDSLNDCWLAGDPSQTATGSDGLGEGVETDDSSVGVEV